jgi:guanine deaminase
MSPVPCRRTARSRVGLGTDLGAGTSFSILLTLNEAYKAAQLNNSALTAGHAYYLATRGTANAMYIDDKVGSIAPGMGADIVVLDMKSTPIIKYRMEFVENIHEALFVQMTMGDDRAVQATYVAGKLQYGRPGTEKVIHETSLMGASA